MGRALSPGELREFLDRVTREITREAGVALTSTEHAREAPEDGLYTVYTTFNRGVDSSLSLCAGMSLFVRLARSILRTDRLTPQDVEDVAKEYFNVLCGHVLAQLYPVTRTPARFNVPAFCRGRHVMEGFLADIVLNFTDDRQEWVQVIHYVPCQAPAAPV